MLTPSFLGRIEPHWWAAGLLAGLGHVGAMAMILGIQGQAEIRPPEPVMVVELPAGAPAASAETPELVSQASSQQPLPTAVAPRIAPPKVEAPLPPDPVTLPTARPIAQASLAPIDRPRPRVLQRGTVTPAAYSGPATPALGTGNAGGGPSDDPEAQRAEADWYALVSAHLNRNKRYPRDAKKAEQQGTPVVSFSVDQRGRVSEVSIRTSSGHDVLDAATLELMQRVSPLPPMPRTMAGERVTITLPIEYSLNRK